MAVWLPPVNIPSFSGGPDYSANLYNGLSGIGDAVVDNRKLKFVQSNADRNYALEQQKYAAGLSNADRNYELNVKKYDLAAQKLNMPGETFRSPTPEEMTARGLNPADAGKYQVSTKNLKFSPIGGQTIQVGSSENAESIAKGKGLGETITEIAKDMPDAQQFLYGAQRLSTLLSGADTGSTAGLIDFVRKNTGIVLGDGADKYQAIQAAVNYLAPRMRPTGSGSSSNFDANQFITSLPGLLGTPGGNELAAQTVGGMAQLRVANAAIARRYQIGEISAKQAFAEMDALPDPFAAFKAWAQTNGGLTTGDGATVPAPGSEGSSFTTKNGIVITPMVVPK